MLILIAESKTMSPRENTVAPEEYAAHMPVCEPDAGRIMELLHGMTADELLRETKLSRAMTARLQQMVYEFPNKSRGYKAIEAYTGVVFKALDYKTLDDVGRTALADRVRIISSLYGWLRPDDIVKPYRLDFTMPLAPEARRLAAFWKGSVTEHLIKEAKARGCKYVLNLLPGDAERCIDIKALGEDMELWKVDFREMQPGGRLATPNANRLKTLRGQLLRLIIPRGITSPQELMTADTDRYMAELMPSRCITLTTAL